MDDWTKGEDAHRGSPSPAFATPTLTFASLLFAIFCLGIVFVLTRRKPSSRGNALLLVGPSDAGKTAILSTFVYNQTLPTHMSLQPNTSVISLPKLKKTIRVIDIPGHPRVRDQFREHLSDANAIAFVVDASTVSRNGPSVAEHLHNILDALTSLPPSQKLPPLLVLAHKADLLKTATSSTIASDTLAVNRVKTILERELERRRASHSGGVGVEGLGAEGEGSDIGGLECTGGGVFRFAEWEGGDVTFIGTSVKVGEVSEKTDEDGLSLLREWLHENV